MKSGKNRKIHHHRKFDNFDNYAEDYRRSLNKLGSFSGVRDNYFCEYKILELLKHERPDCSIQILDLGCGEGTTSRYIKTYFPHSAISGIDISRKKIHYARQKNIPNATFHTTDGLSIPFENNSFDIVFCSMVFHHIAFGLHSTILSEVSRVLKPNGRYYNFEHNPINPVTVKIVNSCKYDKDAVLLTPAYNKKLTNQGGFRETKINYTLFFPRFHPFQYFLFIEQYLTWLPLGAQYYLCAKK